MRILLAIDNSKFSDAALQTVIAQNRTDSAEVRVVQVVEPMDVIFPEGKWQLGMTRDLDEVRRQS
jgi:hypothetical protein